MPLPFTTVNRLLQQHLLLKAYMQDVEPDKLRRRPTPGKWSAHEQLAHLGRYQEIFRDRLEKMIIEENPAFGRYRAEDDPLFNSWLELGLQEIWDKLGNTRTRIASLIVGLSTDQLMRTGQHPRLGTLNILEWIEFFLLHESHHQYAIFWLKHDQQDSFGDQ